MASSSTSSFNLPTNPLDSDTTQPPELAEFYRRCAKSTILFVCRENPNKVLPKLWQIHDVFLPNRWLTLSSERYAPEGDVDGDGNSSSGSHIHYEPSSKPPRFWIKYKGNNYAEKMVTLQVKPPTNGKRYWTHTFYVAYPAAYRDKIQRTDATLNGYTSFSMSGLDSCYGEKKIWYHQDKTEDYRIFVGSGV